MGDRLQTERARAAVERLRLKPGDPDAFFAALVAALRRHGLPSVGACWHLTDPASGLFTSTGTDGTLPGDYDSAIRNELLDDDVAKYAEIARRRRPLAALVAETGGRPRTSARFREQLAPYGFADELRLVFADRFGRWGSLGLFGERVYGEEAIAAAAALLPAVTAELRRGVAQAAAAEEQAAGVIVLDASDHVRLRDARAVALLGGAAETAALPGVVHILAARARAEGRAVSGRMLAPAAGWLALDASPVVGEAGGVTVVVRAAASTSLLDVRMRAAGLTEREREVARAILRGEGTSEIAARLHLSPWTVQDHLKAVFGKTGVRSRRAFVARWALNDT